MAKFHPYLYFNGNTEEANKIMHIALPIGGGYYLMGTDRIKPHGAAVIEGTNMNICLGPDNEEQARKWFAELAKGGTIHTKLDNMPWGALYGDLTDKFGIQWMVNFENR